MILAKELRIGNLLQLNQKWFDDNPLLKNTDPNIVVKEISYDYLLEDELPDSYLINNLELKYLDPIDIEGAWLLTEAGFTKIREREMDFYEHIKSDFRLSQHGREWYVHEYVINPSPMEDGFAFILVAIKYVHELQNVFFETMRHSELIISPEIGRKVKIT